MKHSRAVMPAKDLEKIRFRMAGGKQQNAATQYTLPSSEPSKAPKAPDLTPEEQAIADANRVAAQLRRQALADAQAQSADTLPTDDDLLDRKTPTGEADADKGITDNGGASAA
jgi:hypothetical protein